MNLGKQLTDLLSLRRRPVAVKFQQDIPDGVPRIESAEVSGCSYWKIASTGRTFYTTAEDHYGCPVGSHTHGIELPAEQAEQLEGLVGTMVQLEYLSMDEVPQIPQLTGKFGVAIYAPLSEVEFEPDVVLISGNARQMMLVAEAAHAAGIANDTSMVGRPTCAAIPAVIQSRKCATNLGCIGNRVYTELSDEELYCIVAGEQLQQLLTKLEIIANANRELEKFHAARVQA